jgi:hypothetical protein
MKRALIYLTQLLALLPILVGICLSFPLALLARRIHPRDCLCMACDVAEDGKGVIRDAVRSLLRGES